MPLVKYDSRGGSKKNDLWNDQTTRSKQNERGRCVKNVKYQQETAYVMNNLVGALNYPWDPKANSSFVANPLHFCKVFTKMTLLRLWQVI